MDNCVKINFAQKAQAILCVCVCVCQVYCVSVILDLYPHREFVSVHQNYLGIVLKRVVNNELSQTVRQPTNIQVLTTVVQQQPEESMKVSLY